MKKPILAINNHTKLRYQHILTQPPPEAKAANHIAYLRHLAYNAAYEVRQGEQDYAKNVGAIAYARSPKEKPKVLVAISQGQNAHSEVLLMQMLLGQEKERFSKATQEKIETMLETRSYEEKRRQLLEILERKEVSNFLSNSAIAIFSERDVCSKEKTSDCHGLLEKVLINNQLHSFYYAEDFYKLYPNEEYISKREEGVYENDDGVIVNRVIPSDETRNNIQHDIEITNLRLQLLELQNSDSSIKMKELVTQNQVLEEEKQNFERQSQMLAEQNEELRRQNQKLMSENQVLEEEKQNFERQSQMLAEQNEELRRQNQKLMSENQELNEEVDLLIRKDFELRGDIEQIVKESKSTGNIIPLSNISSKELDEDEQLIEIQEVGKPLAPPNKDKDSPLKQPQQERLQKSEKKPRIPPPSPLLQVAAQNPAQQKSQSEKKKKKKKKKKDSQNTISRRPNM